MSRFLIFISALFITLNIACSRNNTATEEEENVEDLVEEFTPTNGMKLKSLADVPGVYWYFDTIYGVCSPDTFVLWMHYKDQDYMTNVRGVDDKFVMLTSTGLKRIEKDLKSTDFVPVDFNDMAALMYTGGLTHAEFKALRDTAYVRNIEALRAVVTDFYNSQGMTKYMSKALADNWRVIHAQSDAEGVEPPNPFNGTKFFEMEPGSLTVEVSNPSLGMVEVSAYCLDPFTTGRPGWAYWTVIMCIENGQYRVREMPARHRKFTTG